jgi:SPP1 family predicted phage head-tail adaptor
MKKPLPKNQRLEIQRLSNVAGLNDFDEPTTDSWEGIFERWAGILSKGHKEYWRAGQQTLEATHYVEVYSDSDTRTLTVNDRLVWGDRILRILEVSDIENDRQQLAIVCRETTGMGEDE